MLCHHSLYTYISKIPSVKVCGQVHGNGHVLMLRHVTLKLLNVWFFIDYEHWLSGFDCTVKVSWEQHVDVLITYARSMLLTKESVCVSFAF